MKDIKTDKTDNMSWIEMFSCGTSIWDALKLICSNWKFFQKPGFLFDYNENW